MAKRFDPDIHIGETHGVFTIVERLDKKDTTGHWLYKAVCNECGFERISTYGKISGVKSKVMRCRHKDVVGEYMNKQPTWENKRIGQSYKSMKNRCYNDKNKDYKWYGEKGIKICEEWLHNPKTFEKWAIENGYTDNSTIDRIDSNKDYCPENCRWISLEENARRAGKVTWITIEDKTMTGRQWAEYFQLGINTINKFIRNYGLEKTKELMIAMYKEPPITKYRKSRETWFSVYNINT